MTYNNITVHTIILQYIHAHIIAVHTSTFRSLPGVAESASTRNNPPALARSLTTLW